MSALITEYGRYDPADRCWRVSVKDSSGTVSGCIAIKQSVEIVAPEGKRTYMLLEGPGDQRCPTCSGLLAFAEFGEGNGLRLVAHSPALADGADGKATNAKAIQLRKLGPAQWGWIEGIDSGHGGEISSYTVWLPHGTTVQPAGVLPGVGYRVDTSRTQDGYYPITLQAGAERGLHADAREAAFNLATFAYQSSP